MDYAGSWFSLWEKDCRLTHCIQVYRWAGLLCLLLEGGRRRGGSGLHGLNRGPLAAVTSCWNLCNKGASAVDLRKLGQTDLLKRLEDTMRARRLCLERGSEHFVLHQVGAESSRSGREGCPAHGLYAGGRPGEDLRRRAGMQATRRAEVVLHSDEVQVCLNCARVQVWTARKRCRVSNNRLIHFQGVLPRAALTRRMLKMGQPDSMLSTANRGLWLVDWTGTSDSGPASDLA